MRHRAAVLSEYGLLVALIAIAAVGTIGIFGETISNFFKCLPLQLSLTKTVPSGCTPPTP
jgi:Flp pilus assembly pilin Flp